MVGAMAGVVFVLMISLRPMSRMVTVVVGVVYGLVVMAVNSLVVLPITAAIFDSGDAVAHMGKAAGWTTFTVEHGLFGLALGILVAALVKSTHAGSDAPSDRHPTHT